ncbi:hypothetical protein C8R41DRAFT_835856 [Lentinula lateritia]|uniref:Uncharacterized protein n=1 Tax=Lentinula lateritia TaxID=40482 RepID=A0ABQ8VD62_9AGAR|nr:hypothetical protein C8R41DRAFT_835856 [Lentinula lateritia]
MRTLEATGTRISRVLGFSLKVDTSPDYKLTSASDPSLNSTRQDYGTVGKHTSYKQRLLYSVFLYLCGQATT